MKEIKAVSAVVEERMVHEVVTNSDTTEGRGTRVSLGYFLDLTQANEAAHGKGVWGSDARVESGTRKVVIVDVDHVYLLGEILLNKAALTAQARQRALDKLSAEDRQALGIKD